MPPIRVRHPQADLPDPPVVRLVLRLVLRFFLGLFAGCFVGTVCFVMFWSAFDPRLPSDGPAAVVGFGGALLGAVVEGAGAYARNTPVRMLCWALAGAGLGHLLMASLGGLSVGDYGSPSAMVLAVVGAALGRRTVPFARKRPSET